MGARQYKPRQPKGSVAITHKTAKIKDPNTGEIRLYAYYQASKLVEGFDPETGQMFKKRITASAPRKTEALEKLYKKMMYGDKAYEVKPVVPKDTSGTVGEALDAWLEVKQSSRKVRTEVSRKYASYVNKHLKPALGDIPLKDLTKERLETYFEITLPDTKAQKKIDGVWQTVDEPYFTSTSSMLNIYKALSGALNLALDKGLITKNPLLRVDAPKAQKRKDNVGQLSHIAVNLLNHLRQDQHPDYCRFFMPFLGLRSGERLGIQLSDITNLYKNDARIRIHSQLEYEVGVGWFISPKTKSDKQRIIPVPEPFLSVLRDYVKERQSWEKSGDWNPDPRFADLLFLRPNGKLINKKQDTADWHELLKHYNYPYWQQHVNRHITATLLGNQEPPIPIAIVRELLGHYADAMSYYYQTIQKKTMKTNLELYGSVSFAKLIDEPLPDADEPAE
jgi:integrase